MNEPATVLTDFLLGGLAFVLARRSSRLWAGAFLALGVAALVGGTWHAIHPRDLPSIRHQLWTITYVSIGVADLLLLLGAARAVVPASTLRAVHLLLAVKFVAYAGLILWLRDFRHVGYEYGTTLLLLLLAGLELLRRREPAGGFVVAGVLVSFGGGLVQALRLAPHPDFNHNDLFHVIQMVGIWLLFRGGRLLRDRFGGSSPAEPTT